MQTTTPPDVARESPRRDGRNWRPIALAAMAVLAVGAAAIWWFGMRDGGSPPEPVSFTFTDDCTRLADRPTSPAFSAEGPAATFYTCEIRDPSDPRLAGTEIFSYSTSAQDHGIVEIATEDGTWVGSWSGKSFVNQSATGTGDFDGLQATWYGPGCTSNCDWRGTIKPIPEP